jgi:hypothetical protein
VTVDAPQEEIPLLVRAGALIPMLDPAVETLTGYGSGVVHLADRAGSIRIVGWPSGTSKTEIGAGETVTVKESSDGRLIVKVRARRRYRLDLWLSTDLLRHPCKTTHVRHLLLRGRRAQLAVPACPRG